MFERMMYILQWNDMYVIHVFMKNLCDAASQYKPVTYIVLYRLAITI